MWLAWHILKKGGLGKMQKVIAIVFSLRVALGIIIDSQTWLFCFVLFSSTKMLLLG